MDFCLDGMLGVGLNNNGSGNAKQSLCRSASEMDLEQTSRDQDWRTSSSIKMPRTDSSYPTLLRSSSVISEASNTGGVKNNSDFLDESRLSSPYSRALYQQQTTGAYPHQYSSNGATRPPSSVLMGAGMHAILRSPFTPAQWQELELQALIFKYMVANVHVPPELLIPLRTKSGIFSALPAAGSSLRSNMGWGSFHLGFANNADPEPGRCRRTDGKKWRCSRDAVPDQKYCERHMNRGRHRSRKPVEGQTATQQHTATSNSVSLSRNNTSVSVTTSSSPSNPPHHQIGKLSSPTTQFHMPLDRYARGLKGDMETTNISEPSMMNPNSNNGVAWRSRVTSSPSDMVHYGAQDFVNMNILRDQNPRGGGRGGSENSQGSSQGVIRHFFDDWPRSRDRGAGAGGGQWSGTHLSMSMDSCSDKLTLSPLKLSMSARDDPLGMELGLANDPADDEHNRQRQTTNWIPITWESPVGGPLAEVLNSSNNKNTSSHHLNLKSSLNLMPDAWECSGSPGRGDYSRMASPTGVLQKAFGSLSDNSTSSSPRSMLPKLEQAPLSVATPFNVSGVISTT